VRDANNWVHGLSACGGNVGLCRALTMCAASMTKNAEGRLRLLFRRTQLAGISTVFYAIGGGSWVWTRGRWLAVRRLQPERNLPVQISAGGLHILCGRSRWQNRLR
jgi:hypothetical protein